MINEANLSAVYEHDQKVSGSKVAAPPPPPPPPPPPRTRKREQTERPIKGAEAAPSVPRSGAGDVRKEDKEEREERERAIKRASERERGR
jgi:hypothetical protein